MHIGECRYGAELFLPSDIPTHWRYVICEALDKRRPFQEYVMSQSVLVPSPRLRESSAESVSQHSGISGEFSGPSIDRSELKTSTRPGRVLNAIPVKSVMEQNGDGLLHDSIDGPVIPNEKREWRSAREAELVKSALKDVRTELRGLVRLNMAPIPAPLTLAASEEAGKWIASRTTDPINARETFDSVVNELVRKPLVNEAVRGRLSRGGSVEITLLNEKLSFAFFTYND